jgi:hypothetical protein
VKPSCESCCIAEMEGVGYPHLTIRNNPRVHFDHRPIAAHFLSLPPIFWQVVAIFVLVCSVGAAFAKGMWTMAVIGLAALGFEAWLAKRWWSGKSPMPGKSI